MIKSNLIIRLARSDDLADIDRCAKKAYAKYVERMAREPAPMHADFADQIDRGVVSIAIMDNAFAGFVVFYQQDEHIHLENVAVLPELAGRGIGQKLIGHVEQHAIDTGIKCVELYTNEAMHENFGLYVHLGYTEIDRREADGFQRVFYSKLL